MMKRIFFPWLQLKPIGLHGLACFERILDKNGNRNLVLSLAGLLLFWHLYTPIHELLHVAACVLGGGSVTELALKPQYGGTILARVFPFIVPHSDYAGQLTGFTTPNRWVYALVDLFPYILLPWGVTLVEICRRGRRAFLFGLAVILTYIPLLSVPGDYYELASLVTTQIGEALNPNLAEGALISDDVFKSIGALREAGHLTASTAMVIALGFLAAIYLALMTMALQAAIARRIFGPEALAVSPSKQAKTELSQQSPAKPAMEKSEPQNHGEKKD